ncbi:MAG: hypothetical protein ACYSUI_09105 [Planctomycetota bacterium]|jgi:hypothetical protein
MRRFLLFAAASLIALPVVAGDIGFASGQDCAVSADVVSCLPDAGRGSLVITADLAAFTKLRDALTPNWDGILQCNACLVASGFPGCVSVGDEVSPTRKKAALGRLSCILRSHIVQVDLRDAVDSAAAGVDQNPDLGGGDPQ